MPYEVGMTIGLENGRCIVHFRGVRHELPGTYKTFAEANRAGEEFCRKLGWAG
ncbi:hypothetical protein NKI48_23840 [Mesorhizobium sp. M0644]|uniref:hypothetical protein n=1 Tax=unclassified Mesorhizobium TaxID=325217 RepID=UPI003336BE27